MPLISNQNDIVLPDLINQPLVDNSDFKPEVGKTFKYAFQLDNEVGAFVANKARSNNTFDPNFDWSKSFDNLPLDYQLNYGKNFGVAENEEHFNAVKEQIDQELEGNNYLANSGWLGVAARISAGTLSLTNLLPFGLVIKGAKTASALTMGARTAMVATGSIAAQEALLHTQQQTRTLGESAANVSVGALLSGVLGAGMHAAFTKTPKYKPLVTQLEKELDITDFTADVKLGSQEVVNKSAGAAAVVKKTREQLLDENTMARGTVFKPIMMQDPNLRLISSPAVTSRLAMQELSDFVPKLKKNYQGIATPKSVEVERGLDEGRLAGVIQHNRDQFRLYKSKVKDPKARLTEPEFQIEISKALNRNGVSEIPEVAASASKIREDIFKHYGKKGLEIKGFFTDPDSVAAKMNNYFPRVYDRAAISANPAKFQKVITDYFKKEYSSATSGDRLRIYEDAVDGLDDRYFQRMALDVYDHVMGASSSVLHDNVGVSVKPSFSKSRKLLMDNIELEDFLVMDANQIATKYSKLMSSRTRLSERFGSEFLTDNLTGAKSRLIQGVKDEYATLKAAAIGDPKELRSLKAREEQDISDLFALRDRLLGTYGYTISPDSWAYRIQKQVKQYNAVVMLGDVLASSFGDIGKVIMAGGMGKMMTYAIKPLVKSLFSPEFRKYAKMNSREMNRIGVGLDLIDNGRLNALNDIIDDFGKHTKFERVADVVSSKAMGVTGIKHWNAYMKQAVSGVVQSNMHDAMEAVAKGTATTRQIANLASSGIDVEDAKRIVSLVKKHGEIVDDLVFPNISKWGLEDKELGELYAGSILSATNSSIVTPGIGTTPLWMSRHGLTLFGQFQSFAFSSIQKTLIPIVQDFDAKTVQGLTVMVGLGTLIAAYKRAANGDKMPDTATLIQEGVDRSGTLGWMMDYNNRLEKLSQGNVGISRIFGTHANSKYSNYGSAAVLGPTSGQIDNLSRVAGGILSGNVTQSTTHAARRLLPLQTMLGVRQTLDILEEEFNSSLGITKK